MTKPSSPKALADATGISIPYASQLLSDDPKQRRTPSHSLAIHIMRSVGWRHPVLDPLSDDQIEALETVKPWKSSPSQVAA